MSPFRVMVLVGIRTEAKPVVLQTFLPHLPIPPPQCFRLAIAQLQHDRGIAQLQLPTARSPHDFHPLQLTTAHGCPLQQDLPGWRSQSKGTFLKRSEGDTIIIIKFQQKNWVGKTILSALGMTRNGGQETEREGVTSR